MSRVVRCWAAPLLLASSALAQSTQAPAPIERRPPSHSVGSQAGLGHPGTRGEHLAEWMNQHSSLTPQQQQQALQQEPGFQQQPRAVQQRMLDRLAQLDAMAPQQRQRVLARTEAMERLNPDQRAEVRAAMGQLGGLPPDQRRPVVQTFHLLRQLPAEERVQAYASGRVGSPLNDTQRAVLMNLLRVAPMLPPTTAPAPNPTSPLPPAQAFH